MKKTGRFLARGLIVILILVLVVGSFGLFYFKSHLPNKVAEKSFPQIAGEIQIPGLDGRIDIYRDGIGIPHIYASTTHDLFFAQGYVHAQERFWQMDTWRHIGSGSLSEMFGKAQVDTDTFLRTLGWKRVAEQEWEQLSPDAQEILQSYGDGVNAYLKDHDGEAVSLEYSVLGLLSPDYTIEPWTPIHSLTWGKAMAWDLGGNMDREIDRAILLKTLSPEQVAELYPEYPMDYAVIVPSIGENVQVPGRNTSAGAPSPEIDYSVVAEKLALLHDVLGPTGSGIGSNSWVVSGELTTTGKPLLANDMHLGIQMPSIWFQNSLHCAPKSESCPFEVTGFSFPGVPGVVAGHNDRIAWAFTNLGPDVQDLFIEKINPQNPNQYEVNGKWVDFELIEDTIKVVGGKPQQITIRVSRHGPIISDSYGPLKDEVDPKDPEALPFREKSGIALPQEYAIALSWTALSPNSPFEAIWGFNRSQNWEEFRQSARKWSVPAQNLLYADVDGNIGYQTPGNIPIRKNGDGTIPVPGWNSEYDWTGFINFDDLPYVFNPSSGYIVTANNQANPRDYPYLITKDWDYGQRASRIVDMIESAPDKIDIAYFQQMHGDSKSLNAEVLVPVLLSVELNQDLAKVRDQYLASWDYKETADSSATVLFESFWWNLLEDTFGDELPKDQLPTGGSRWYIVMRNLVQQPESPWWDDKTTPDQVETRDDIIAKAFESAVKCEACIKQFGKDISQWKWGELHSATFRNQTLGKAGISLIEDLFNRGPFTTGGGESIVNATGWTVGKTFEVDWLPSEREIVDLSNLNASLAAHTTGQSGHAYHPHYDDMIPLWASVQYYPMWWERQAIIDDSEGLLILKP